MFGFYNSPFLFRRKKGLLLPAFFAVAFLFSTEIFAVKTVEISERVKIYYSDAYDADVRGIRSFLGKIDFALNSLLTLKTSNRSAFCSVFLSERDFSEGIYVENSGVGIRVYVPKNFSDWANDFRTHCEVVSAIMLNKCGLNAADGYKKIPAWICAGVLHRGGRKNISGGLLAIVTYPGVRALVLKKCEPDIWTLINNPLEYSDGPAYGLYAECCGAFLDALSSSSAGREALLHSIRLSAEGSAPDEAVRQAFPPLLKKSGFKYSESDKNKVPPAEDATSAWFKTVLRNKTVNIFHPADTSYFESRFNELNNIRYAAVIKKDKDGVAFAREERACLISEIGAKWNEIENPGILLESLNGKLTELLCEAPVFMQPPLSKMIKSLLYLRGNDAESFTEDFTEALKEFDASLQTSRELELFLDESGKKFVSPSARRSFEIDYLTKCGSVSESLWPSLQSYLEREEEKFE